MAKFWSEHKNLVTGDNSRMIEFRNGEFSTEDPEQISILRDRMKIRALKIVEVTPRETDSKALAPEKAVEKAKK
ncbi:hypothetical protein MASR1M12_18870 [Erysipelotrichia bacterium]